MANQFWTGAYAMRGIVEAVETGATALRQPPCAGSFSRLLREPRALRAYYLTSPAWRAAVRRASRPCQRVPRAPLYLAAAC